MSLRTIFRMILGIYSCWNMCRNCVKRLHTNSHVG